MPIVQGQISIISDDKNQGTSLTPTAKLYFQIDPAQLTNIQKATVYWETTNASIKVLKIERLTFDGQSTYALAPEISPIEIDVTNDSDSGYEVIFDPVYFTRLTLIATNINGVSINSNSQIVSNYKTQTVIDQIYDSTTDFSIQREQDSFNKVKGVVNLVFSESFNKALITSVQLLYRIETSEKWNVINLSYQPPNLIDNKTNGNLSGYSIFFNGIEVSVPSIGSAVYFKIKIAVLDKGDSFSKEKILFFDQLTPATDSNPSNTFVDLTVAQKLPASLRYEIKTTISEGYYQSENIKADGVLLDNPNSFSHAFLDTEQFKGRSYSQHVTNRRLTEYFEGFPYERSENYTTNIFDGYFYPACVSEILPCINIIQDSSGKTNSIILFWKIIDNFFDYSFFENSINIKTTKFEVSVEYYDSSTSLYKTIKAQSTIEEGNSKQYNTAENKFVLKVTRQDAVSAGNESLFDKISIVDNKTRNLRIAIKKHAVTCSNPVRSIDYSFDKLLLPPHWTHIVYDEFIDSSLKNESEEQLNIPLDHPVLRGIRLPDRGFKTFDVLNNFKFYAFESSGIKSNLSDLKIFYKLKSKASVFYLDPIRNGAILSIQLPEKPDDVFLIPPSVEVPSPNIDPNGKKAEAEVKLDQYGKISGIIINDPGYGYSIYNNATNQRIQSYSDLIPILKCSYKVLSSNRNITKAKLNPVNSSYSNLKASLVGGKLLSQIGQNDAVLNSDQQKILEDYKSRNNISDNSSDLAENIDEDSSVKPYLNTKNNSSSNTSIAELDPEWFSISSLYFEKNNSPFEQVSIYNENIDASVEEIDDSSAISSVTSSNNSSEVISPIIFNEGSIDQEKTGETFSLNNLPVYSDGSPGVTIVNSSAAPPSLTLLPLSLRPDGSPAYGTLPNMLPRSSSFFNRLATAINLLNEVRIILPTVWAVQETRFSNSYYKLYEGNDDFEIVSFSTDGRKFSQSQTYSYYAPSNSGLTASASRSVGKSDVRGSYLPSPDMQAGVYIVSVEDGGSVSFENKIHPWMLDTIKHLEKMGLNISNINNSFAIKSTNRYSCSSVPAQQENGVYFIACDSGGGNQYQKVVPNGTQIPYSNFDSQSQYIFIRAGSISESPSGTANALSIPNGRRGSFLVFCGGSCGSSTSTSLDFKYSNFYPKVAKL